MINFIDFENLHDEQFRREIGSRINHIIANNQFVEGEYNTKFERDFAKLNQTEHCLLVANGTDALEISLLAHGIEKGDLIAVPGITFYATAEAVLNVGAIPLFVDVEKNTGLMCPDSLKRTLQKYSVKAVIPVHIYGLPADMNQINSLCQPKNIPVIEDAAQASGTIVNGKPVGDSPNLVTFSFYPTKNLSAFGDAGAILTKDEELVHKIKCIRNHGRGSDGHIMGRNSRCDHIQAAVLWTKLQFIEEQNLKRKSIATLYHSKLDRRLLEKQNIHLLGEKYLKSSSFHLYPIFMENPETQNKLKIHLEHQKIPSAGFYARALSQEPALSEYMGEKSNAEAMASAVLCLPIHPFLSDDQVSFIVDAVHDFCVK